MTSNELMLDEEYDDNDESQIDEYDLTTSPNDFNIKTISDYIESGVINIPSFQRNYVWEINQASKLIESLILGLPVPQIFLYEEGRNKWLVIDGQQRLLSIYYFVKQRFPKKEKRTELRNIFSEHGNKLPEEILNDDGFFVDFKLKLPKLLSDKQNKFNGLTYDTLDDYKFRFDMRPLRNIIVKQNVPNNDNSSIYEVFNRLNTGGVNLELQEIRISLYHSEFYKMLFRLNENSRWREILKLPEPDFRSKDIDILLRSFAMLVDFDNYKPPLKSFLNQFANKTQKYDNETNQYLEKLFKSFLRACRKLPNEAFFKSRFSPALFEAVFTAKCKQKYQNRKLGMKLLNYNDIERLKKDKNFQSSTGGTMSKEKVQNRLNAASKIIGS